MASCSLSFSPSPALLIPLARVKSKGRAKSQVKSSEVRSGQIRSHQVKRGQVKSNQIISRHIGGEGAGGAASAAACNAACCGSSVSTCPNSLARFLSTPYIHLW